MKKFTTMSEQELGSFKAESEDRFNDRNKWPACVIRFLLLALLCPAASAFELNTPEIKWTQAAIPLAYMEDGCNIDIKGSAEKALETWGLKRSIQREPEGIGFDDRSTIYCSELDLAELLILPDDVEVVISNIGESGQVVATTHTYFRFDRIVDFDVRLHPTLVTEESLDRVMLHEVGHGLGFKHSTIEKSIMWWKVDNNEDLHADDLLAGCILYDKCHTLLDDNFNLAVPKVEYEGTCYHAILNSGGVWPDDAYMAGIVDCN